MSLTIPEDKLFDWRWRVENTLTITNKSREVVPFRFNKPQSVWYDARYGPAARRIRVVLKARQQGMSSAIIAVNTLEVTTKPGTTCLVISFDHPTTILQRGRVERWLRELHMMGQLPKIGKHNDHMIEFPGLDSRFLFQTAGGVAPGLSWPVNILHATEVPRWPDPEKILEGVRPSIPPDGIIDYESTPYGQDPIFYVHYMMAAARELGYEDTTPLFFPWWFTDEYRAPVPPEGLGDLTDEERILKATHHLDDEQIMWRRIEKAKQDSLGGSFMQWYPEDDVTCFITGGSPVIVPEAIRRLQQFAGPPIREEEGGLVRIYEEPDPAHDYVLGLDPAEGLANGCDSAGFMLDTTTNRHVATIQGRIPPFPFAAIAMRLGHQYNDALLSPERTGVGVAVTNKLVEAGYPNIYRDRTYHQGGVTLGQFGWWTSPNKRYEMGTALADEVNSNRLYSRDENFIRQLGNLNWAEMNKDRDKRKLEATPGSYVDICFAAMIAICTRQFAVRGSGNRVASLGAINASAGPTRVARIGAY